MHLVARDAELARLLEFLAGCDRGPSVLVLEGEPGIGKTALLEAALAACSGLRLLRVRCAQAESGAYVSLADLLGPWIDTVLPRWTSHCCALTLDPRSWSRTRSAAPRWRPCGCWPSTSRC